VGDLPGGTRQPFLNWGRYAATFLVVVEPGPASLLTGRRLARLAAMAGSPRVLAVANKVRGTDDVRRVAEGTGLPVGAAVPFDPAVAAAARSGVPLLDQAPDGPAAEAVRSLLHALRDREAA
jgi:CO dehydrogenase maturation factor